MGMALDLARIPIRLALRTSSSIAVEKSEFQQLLEFIGLRFDRIDQRFEAIDQQFRTYDQRFEQIESRLTRLEVLFEEFRSDFRVVVDAIRGVKDELAEFRKEMNARFENLERIVMDFQLRVSRLEARRA